MTKRPWEEAKAQYRADLKLWSLKAKTQFSDETIKRALGLVHEDRMKAREHVELAMAFVPRLDGMIQQLAGRGVNESAALTLIKQTYSRTDGVMINAEDHLQAALANAT